MPVKVKSTEWHDIPFEFQTLININIRKMHSEPQTVDEILDHRIKAKTSYLYTSLNHYTIYFAKKLLTPSIIDKFFEKLGLYWFRGISLKDVFKLPYANKCEKE